MTARLFASVAVWILMAQLTMSESFAQERRPAAKAPRLRSVHSAAMNGVPGALSLEGGVDLDVLDIGDSAGSAIGLRVDVDWFVFGGSDGVQYAAAVRWTEHWAEWRMDFLVGASSWNARPTWLGARVGVDLRTAIWPHLGGVLFRGQWRMADGSAAEYMYVGVGLYFGWDTVS